MPHVVRRRRKPDHPTAAPRRAAGLPLSRRAVLAGLGATTLLSTSLRAGAPLRVLLAPSTASVLVARAAMTPDVAPVEVDVWRSPDQLRAAVIARRADAFTLPTNVAANLYNRGHPLRFATVLAAGPMQLVTRAPDLSALAELRGRRVQLYFKNDMPDISLRWLLREAGLEPGRDVALDYGGSAVEAAQLLLAGRAETALLNEPAASTVLLEATKAGEPLRRAFTLQAAWAEVTGQDALLPMAGLAFRADFAAEDPARVRALNAAIAGAADWATTDPDAAGALAADTLGFRSDAVAGAFDAADVTVAAASSARRAIERFLAALATLEPALIGERLPDDGFYLAP